MVVLQRSARLATAPPRARLGIRAGALEASFRTYKVLQREEQEFYWGKRQQWGFCGQPHNLQTCSSGSTTTGTTSTNSSSSSGAASVASSLQSAASYLELLQAVQVNLHALTGPQLHYAVMRLSVYADQGDRPPDADVVPIGHRLATTVGQLGREQLVTALWAVACLGLRDRAACEALLLAAADRLQEMTSGGQDIDQQDLVTLLWALGCLASAAYGPLAAPAPPVQDLVTHLCGQLSNSEAGPLRELTSPEDRTDLAVGLARLAVAWPAGAPARQAAEGVMQRLAGDVQRDLSNKHSSSGTVFTARQLGSFVGAYARLGCCTGTVPRMLDAISNTVVAGIRVRHLHSISRAEDMVRLLAALRDLRHSSVAVPELLRALALQLRTELACMHEMANRAPPGQATSSLCEPGVAADLLQCYLDLHHSPGTSLLQALWVDLCSVATPVSPPAAARLLLATLQLAYHPGTAALDRFLARLPPATTIDPPSVASISCTCALLDHPLPAPLLTALQALLATPTTLDTHHPTGQPPVDAAAFQGADGVVWHNPAPKHHIASNSSVSDSTGSSASNSSVSDSTGRGASMSNNVSSSHESTTRSTFLNSGISTSSTSTTTTNAAAIAAAAATSPNSTDPDPLSLLRTLRALGCSGHLDLRSLQRGLRLLVGSTGGRLSRGQLAVAVEACWLAGAAHKHESGSDKGSARSSEGSSGESVVHALAAAGLVTTEAEGEQAWADHLQQLLDSSVLPPSRVRPFHDAFTATGWLTSETLTSIPICGHPTSHLLTLYPSPPLLPLHPPPAPTKAAAPPTNAPPPADPHMHPRSKLPSYPASADAAASPSSAVPSGALLVVWRQAAASDTPSAHRLLGAAVLLRRLLRSGLAEGQVLVEAHERDLAACSDDAERRAVARRALAAAGLPTRAQDLEPVDVAA